jgi:TonB family protein
MNRLQKKCLIASGVMHGFLLLVVVFGAAFFTPEKKPAPVASLTMVPSKLLDSALSGGGGNPNIAPSDAKIKGDTLNPVPPQPQPVKPPQPKTVEVPKPQPQPQPTKADIPKDPPKTAPKQAPIQLTPIDKSATAKTKAPTDNKPKTDPKAAQKELAKEIGKIRENMRQGFTSGTAVQVSGPGGEAYASYRSFVFAAYDNAWQVTPDVANEESVVVARVVIHRSGKILSAEISQRSGNSLIDKSVRRALDSVTSLPPFPEGARDQERTFVIEFSLKAKRLIG